MKGVGATFLEVIKAAEDKKQAPYNPPAGKFSSVASAALVSLFDYENERNPDPCSMEELLRRINQLVHSPGQNIKAFPKDITYYLDKNNLDTGWMQVSDKFTFFFFLSMMSYITAF